MNFNFGTVGFLDINIEDYVGWEFDWTQFQAAQGTCSGANLGPTAVDSLSWIIQRDNELEDDGYDYCRFGVWETEEEGTHYWYETTSGTILIHSFVNGEDTYSVYLPESRLGGNHNKELDYAKQGRTLEQYNQWYNAYLFLEERAEDYDEESTWHNTHMVELGYEPMLTLEQFRLKCQLDDIFQYFHGRWADSYGLAKDINILLGSSECFFKTDPKPGSPVAQGDLRRRILQSIRSKLSFSLEKIEILSEIDVDSIESLDDAYDDYDGVEDYNYES
jgi:hypothetical protein